MFARGAEDLPSEHGLNFGRNAVHFYRNPCYGLADDVVNPPAGDARVAMPVASL